MSLFFLAACAVSVNDVERAFPWEKEAINRAIAQRLFRPQYFKSKSLHDLCSCNQNGDCLCYLNIIKEHMIDTAWHTEEEYSHIGNWIR